MLCSGCLNEITHKMSARYFEAWRQEQHRSQRVEEENEKCGQCCAIIFAPFLLLFLFAGLVREIDSAFQPYKVDIRHFLNLTIGTSIVVAMAAWLKSRKAKPHAERTLFEWPEGAVRVKRE